MGTTTLGICLFVVGVIVGLNVGVLVFGLLRLAKDDAEALDRAG